MSKTKQVNDYCTPLCEVLLVAQAEMLCTSTVKFGASTEDMGNLEDIFGAN